MVKFQSLAQFPVDHLPPPVMFAPVFLLCQSVIVSSRPLHWSLWNYFVLQLKSIRFLSCHLICNLLSLLLEVSIQLFFFPSLLLVAMIILSLLFFVYFMSYSIVAFSQSLLSFLNMWSLSLEWWYHHSSIRFGASSSSSSVSLSFGLFVLVILMSILRMDQSILKWGLSKHLFIWWDFCSWIFFFFCCFPVCL